MSPYFKTISYLYDKEKPSSIGNGRAKNAIFIQSVMLLGKL